MFKNWFKFRTWFIIYWGTYGKRIVHIIGISVIIGISILMTTYFTKVEIIAPQKVEDALYKMTIDSLNKKLRGYEDIISRLNARKIIINTNYDERLKNIYNVDAVSDDSITQFIAKKIRN